MNGYGTYVITADPNIFVYYRRLEHVCLLPQVELHRLNSKAFFDWNIFVYYRRLETYLFMITTGRAAPPQLQGILRLERRRRRRRPDAAHAVPPAGRPDPRRPGAITI